MAEDGRPAEHGHCLLALPRALALFVTRVVLRPDRWFTVDVYPTEAADAPDDVMAVADAVAEPPARRDVTAEQRRTWRASNAWLGYATEDTDWHALEYMATGKRTEVTH